MVRSHEVLALLGLATHTCNPGAWEAEPGGLPQTQGEPGLNTEANGSLGLYKETLFPKNMFLIKHLPFLYRCGCMQV